MHIVCHVMATEKHDWLCTHALLLLGSTDGDMEAGEVGGNLVALEGSRCYGCMQPRLKH